MTTFVIYTVDFSGNVKHTEVTCKKPAMTKAYKNAKSEFSRMDINKFGFMPKKDFDTQKKWLGH